MQRRQGEVECVVMEKVWFVNSLGQRLAGVVHLPAGGSRMGPTVILCHGMMSSKEGRKQTALAEALCAQGCSVLRFDFSFCGESQGRFEEITFSQEIDDLKHAVAWTKARGARPIGLLGSSMGGAVAILYSLEDQDIEALVTIAAVAHPSRIAAEIGSLEEYAKRWKEEGYRLGAEGRVGPRFFEDVVRHDVVGAAARITAPWLILHGSADEVVPVGDARDLYANAAGPKELKVIAGADHRFTREDHLEELIRDATIWFKKYLLGTE